MPSAVLDSATLISAFLKPGGVADLVLQQAYERAFELFLAEEFSPKPDGCCLKRIASASAMPILMKACIASLRACMASRR
jgi:hypothetical protein